MFRKRKFLFPIKTVFKRYDCLRQRIPAFGRPP